MEERGIYTVEGINTIGTIEMESENSTIPVQQIIVNLRELANYLEQLIQQTSHSSFPIEEFKTWDSGNEIFKTLVPEYVIKNGFSEGHCRNNSTCQHNSHDPYEEGDLLYISCKYIGTSDGKNRYYLYKDNITIFSYRVTDNGNYNNSYRFELTPVLDVRCLYAGERYRGKFLTYDERKTIEDRIKGLCK